VRFAPPERLVKVLCRTKEGGASTESVRTPALQKMAARQMNGGHLADARTLPACCNHLIAGPPFLSEQRFHVTLYHLRSDGGPALLI
jgi:hypothetical protein